MGVLRILAIVGLAIVAGLSGRWLDAPASPAPTPVSRYYVSPPALPRVEPMGQRPDTSEIDRRIGEAQMQHDLRDWYRSNGQ